MSSTSVRQPLRRRPRVPASRWALGLALLGVAPAAVAQPAPPPAAAQPAPPPAAAPPATPPAPAPLDVAAAIELYRSARYDDCAKVFGELFATGAVSDGETLRARYHHIACLVGAHDLEAADAVIRAAVRENPQLAPDRRDFPAPVVDRFHAVRGEMVAEIERQQREAAADAAKRARKEREERERKLERLRTLAASETVVEPRSRWLAAVPFGVGQFQNGDTALGWTFLVGEGLLLAGLVTAVTIEMNLIAKADQKKDLEVLSANLDDARLATTLTAWGLAGVGAIGIAQAQLAFEPERITVRRRPLPPDLRARSSTPGIAGVVAAPVRGGAGVTVAGSF